MGIEFDSGLELAREPLPQEPAAISSSRASADGAFFVVCGACRGVLRLDPRSAGKLGRCPSCMRLIQVPDPGPDPERVRRTAHAAVVTALSTTGAAAFVLGLAKLAVGAVSSEPVAGLTLSLALGGALVLVAAVGAAFGELQLLRRAVVCLATGVVPAVTFGGVVAGAPLAGLAVMVLGSEQLLARASKLAGRGPDFTTTLVPRERLRVTSRPRPSPVSA